MEINYLDMDDAHIRPHSVQSVRNQRLDWAVCGNLEGSVLSVCNECAVRLGLKW